MSKKWLLYGAYGYTGELTARMGVERGMTPILAGRSEGKVKALAERLDLPFRVFSLDDDFAHHLEDVEAVLHDAGPYSKTSKPMVDACLATKTHYLDVTGEIDVFEAIHHRDAEAKAAGIALIPGVGFDVVPTDCLAAQLAQRLPDATQLELAFHGGNAPSRGTARTVVEGLPKGGRARIDGHLVAVENTWKVRDIPFADKARTAVTIPWGDVSTAYYSTNIPNIWVYRSSPPSQIRWLRRLGRIRPLLGLSLVQRALKKLVDWRITGPSDDQRTVGASLVWGAVENPDGIRVTGRVTAQEGYTLTADASLKAVAHVLKGGLVGSLTPSMAFGADFLFELDGVEADFDPAPPLTDVSTAAPT